jgi:hypothetical protein
MKTFFRYLFGTIFLPRRAFGRLMADPRPMRRGVQAVLLAGALWVLTTAVLAVTGAVPMAPIFLHVRVENYHFWQMLFILPLFFLIWIFASVLVHVLGRGSRKGGSLRRTLAVFGFSLAGPVILLWAPQTAIAVFYGLGMGQQEMVDILSGPGRAQTLYLAAHGLALLWAYSLCSVAASVSQKINWWKGLALGILSGTLFAAAAVVFLR